MSEPGFIGFTGLARCCASTKEQRENCLNHDFNKINKIDKIL
jgi:hypothetical protein